ncbi:class I SAM-dependent methyltransferase [Natronorubrum daqingense]|uniref:SAM-dependent methyltransferase n=1 Tax=Natronorubrum daqingense TaxID=588898 RepID=A0A1N7BW89_9EURY|nr:class I SAM-dependent methyltransferase [Natronorubrum daqingense]APX96622.1 SAM-dependent methyltransferase [Natronorubrum daqingense]SIR55592.1 Trans-aconitate methyltransferase [Natronorubrum daqingense]
MTEEPTVSNRWDADEYDGNHSFVHEYGSDVLELLEPNPDERILDLGCGTGHLTDRIAATGAEAVGVDAAPEMIERARDAHASPTFRRVDARELTVEEPVDAVFSNAALHWIDDEDQDDVLASVRDALRPGGRFVAELGGARNVERIVEATMDALEERGYDAANPWYFPSIGEYAGRLESHGFEVRFARLFDRPTELEDGEGGLQNWLGMFGDSFFAACSEDEQAAVIDDVESELESSLYDPEEETWTADYRRLRFRAVRV